MPMYRSLAKLISFLFLLCFMPFACKMGECIKGEGPSTTMELTVAPFQHLVLKSSFDIRLQQGSTQKIVVEGPANLSELITTEVIDGIWNAGIEECYRSKPALVIHVTVPELQAITIKGSGDIRSQGVFRSTTMDLTIQGSGDLDLELEAASIKATVQGSGDVLLHGSTDSFETRIQGSGDVNAMELEAIDVKASIMGSGNVAVQCNGLLDVSIMGSGDILYRGEPREIIQNIKGSGAIRAEQ